jgi:hypothetical protein
MIDAICHRALPAAVIVFAATLSASAEDHAIDFTAVLMGMNEQPLTRPADSCLPTQSAPRDCPLADMTLGDAAVTALESPLDEDHGEDGRKKFDRDQLARKIYHNKAASLSVDDVALIKGRIGKTWSSAVVGAAWLILDPGGADKK